MKFFADTADLDDIRDLAATGLLDGVTTNPSLVRKAGGFTFQELNLTVDDIAAMSQGGADLSYDFITRPAYHHALVTGDTAFLRLMLRTVHEYGIDPASLIHALTVCTGPLLLALSKLRRLVFPSTAICLPVALSRIAKSSAQARNTVLKASGSSAPNTARKTSWVGAPWGIGRNPAGGAP